MFSKHHEPAARKRFLHVLILLMGGALAPAATVIVGSWMPTFKGIELATGQQIATLAGEKNHQVMCWRVDLTDPDVQLFTTPHCTNNCGQETLAENTSHFVEQYGLQAAINGGFYGGGGGPSDSPLGTPDDVFGLAISRGAIVSPVDSTTNRVAFLFTTNKQAFYVPTNSPPGTNTAGIYTAISGNNPLLINGTNVQTANPTDLDPRTALGLSADRRYLYMMTIDGRQTGWSDGSDFYNVGEWLKRFGAYDGICIDGGGSTTLVMANCEGKAVRLNRSSFVFQYGRERNVGHNFGVYAAPLSTDIKDMTIAVGSTTATITWRTEVPATAQIEYGLTSSYGSTTPLDSRLLTRHAATLNGLAQGSNYFFRIISVAGGQTFTQACSLTTTTTYTTTQNFGLTNSWKYNTNNFDGVNWKTNGFNDSAWAGGPGLLYALESNIQVAPRNTQMPPASGTAVPRTYYFRTHFNFSSNASGALLTFSNYVDDGAVFHLNGTEMYRLRMAGPPTVITYATAATNSPCTGTAQQGDAATICPDVFSVGGNLVATNLVQGDNILAVEVHNASAGAADIVFGSALFQSIPPVIPPRLTAWMEGSHGTIFWNAAGYTLQRSSDISSTNNWVDVPGPNTQSPHNVTNGTTWFYRLRN